MSIIAIPWLMVLLSLAGIGPLETETGLIVKQQLLILPPHSAVRYKTLPGLNGRDPRQPIYRIYNFKQ